MDNTLRSKLYAAKNQTEARSDSFVALYDHYFPRVYSYVLYRVQDPPTAADITADTFERALRQWPRYDPDRAAASTWLFAIANNTLKNHFRWQKVRHWLPIETLNKRATPEPPLENAFAQNERTRELLKAIADLTDRERELLGLKFGASFTNRRIAEVTGLTESNVGVILYRAVNRLKDKLGVSSEVYHE